MSTADDTEVCTQRTGEKTLIITMNPYKEAVKHVGPAITENQLKKWASDGHKARASTLANSSTIKGLLVSNENKKLKAIYMPRVVVDETENSVLVGTISNHADKPKIRVLPLEALKSYFVVQTKANAPLGVPFGDEPLDLSHPAIASFFPTENEEHHLQGTFFVAKVPTAMPIPLNTSNIVLGDIFEQSVEETAMAIDEDWGMGWIECLRSANPGLSDILAKEPELQKYLPRTQSREMGDPYCTFEAPNDDDDNIAQAETKIIQECEDIVKTSKDTVPRMINGGGGEAPEQPNADGGNFGDLIRLMGQGFKNASNESEKASQLNANKKHFEGITKLMTAHLETDPRTSEKVLVLGKLSKCAQMIIDNATSVRSMSTIFEQGLSQTIRRHQDSENFLLRSVNFPVLEQAVKGFMGTGLYHQRTLKNLTDKKIEGLVITMLIPDTKDTSAKKKNNASDTIAEDAIGEAIEKRNKLSTAYTPVGALNCLEDLLAMLSNDITRLATLAEFDEFDMKNKEKVPFLVYASNRIAQFLTNRKAKDWMKDYKDTVRAPALFCFIAFRICAIVTDMAEALSQLDQTVAACEDRTMDISIEPYLEATSSLENTMDEIRRIILGTEIVSSMMHTSTLSVLPVNRTTTTHNPLLTLDAAQYLRTTTVIPNTHQPTGPMLATPGFGHNQIMIVKLTWIPIRTVVKPAGHSNNAATIINNRYATVHQIKHHTSIRPHLTGHRPHIHKHRNSHLFKIFAKAILSRDGTIRTVTSRQNIHIIHTYIQKNLKIQMAHGYIQQQPT